MAALAFAAALLAAVASAWGADAALEARVGELLRAQGLGAEALLVVDNALRHEPPSPRDAPPLVRELLARPLDSLDPAAVFDRVVPRPLLRAAQLAVPPASAQPFARLLDDYVREIAAARAELLVATGNAPLDAGALVAELAVHGHPSAGRLLQVAAATDLDGLAVANERFIDATLRFARALREARDLPPGPVRLETAVGSVVIGSAGDDRHEPGAALIIDPGGDDVYERAPATAGAVAVVIDLAGNDTYGGSDVAVRGFSAIVDLAGDDRYEMRGPGLGAALAGASLLVDAAGNDRYRAPHVSQGMAAFGIGALLDLGGDDTYDLDAWGQGFALAGGLGLLWDVAGNDRYGARGPADGYDRGGGLSGAQGTAMGPRNLLPGGVAVLRDDGGDDVYVAEMFAQGTGYYYGLGLLWDRGGDDRYQAIRYAQGAGVHEAVGILADEGGKDRYSLKVGVGQGMGLDLALGTLLDANGDDDYQAGLLAQASGTANGIGVLLDRGGADRFEIGQGDRQWGHAEWSRGLPTVGVFLHEPAQASFATDGKPLAAPPPARKVMEAEPEGKCLAGVRVSPEEVATVLKAHFDSVYALGQRIICAVHGDDALPLWRTLGAELERDPATTLGAWIAIAYRRAPPPADPGEEILRRLDAHPSCTVRALALAAAPRAALAREALRSDCYRLQAQALRTLEGLGEPVPAGVVLPAFLAPR